MAPDPCEGALGDHRACWWPVGYVAVLTLPSSQANAVSSLEILPGGCALWGPSQKPLGPGLERPIHAWGRLGPRGAAQATGRLGAPPQAAGTRLTRPHRLHQDHAVPADREAEAVLVLLDDDAALNETWAQGAEKAWAGAVAGCGSALARGAPSALLQKTRLAPPHARATRPPSGATAPRRAPLRGAERRASPGVPAPPGPSGCEGQG